MKISPTGSQLYCMELESSKLVNDEYLKKMLRNASEEGKTTPIVQQQQIISKAVDSDETMRKLATTLVQKKAELTAAQQKLSSDQKYIRVLHEYNYLKDAAF